MKRLIMILAGMLIFPAALYPQEFDSTDFVDRIKSFFGKNQPRLGFMSQFAAELRDDRTGTSSEFTIRNLRLYVTGSSGDDFSYYFQGNLNGTFSLLDLKLMYRLGDHFRVDAGRLKTPYSSEYLRNDARLSFVSRSTAAMTIGPFRQYGVQLNGSFAGRKIQFTTGIFNGDDPVKKKISLFVGRILLTPVMKEENSRGFQVEAGGSMAYSGEYDDLSALPYYGKNHILMGGYARILFGDFWLEGEYLNSNSNKLKTREGFYADVGKKFGSDFEVMGRIDWFAKYPSWLSRISRKYVAGVNYYPARDLKLQFNYERDKTYEVNSAYLNFQYAVNFE